MRAERIKIDWQEINENIAKIREYVRKTYIKGIDYFDEVMVGNKNTIIHKKRKCFLCRREYKEPFKIRIKNKNHFVCEKCFRIWFENKSLTTRQLRKLVR